MKEISVGVPKWLYMIENFWKIKWNVQKDQVKNERKMKWEKNIKNDLGQNQKNSKKRKKGSISTL